MKKKIESLLTCPAYLKENRNFPVGRKAASKGSSVARNMRYFSAATIKNHDKGKEEHTLVSQCQESVLARNMQTSNVLQAEQVVFTYLGLHKHTYIIMSYC